MKNPSPFFASQFIVLTLTIGMLLIPALSGVAAPGATVPWMTYEAENMTINGGAIIGPPPRAVDKNVEITNTVAAESSGRLCVKLATAGQYVELTAQAAANAMVVRYSIPDSSDGAGIDSTISLYVNGTFIRKVPVTSKYSWLYGGYTFSNNPGDGNARDYYDEARLLNLSINSNDHVRLQVDADDTAPYYIIDLVDLENVAPPLPAPPDSRSVLNYGAVGNGIADDTVAIKNCVAAGPGIVWVPSGNYLLTNDVDVPSGVTIQGAGMWYTTFVGNPATYLNERGRVRFNGAGSDIHFADFAIIGKLNTRNDSHANDGFSEVFGTNSSISRVWVEHTKTGAWLANANGMVIQDCRFRNTLADGINLCVGMHNTIVTNCTARNTGDDSFAIWPATYRTAAYEAGNNVFSHCTAQSPFFANCVGIYGGVSNRVEDCLLQDTPDGCGILIAGTFPIGTNVFRGMTVAQRCDLIRCGGNDPGWRWRGALTLCPDGVTVNGLNINNINISNALSYAVQVVSPGSGTLSNAGMSDVNVFGYAVGVPPYHPEDPFPFNTNYCDGVFGVFARSDAKGMLNVSGLTVNGTNLVAVQTNKYLTDCVDQSSQFAFNFLSQPITVAVQANPPGHSFSVDGTNYTSSQSFNWIQGSTHIIGTTSPQNSGTGVQDVWTSWSDGGAISHTITPMASTAYIANFATQFYLTVNSGAGGSVNPASGWQNSGATVNITATPATGFRFTNWTGSGSGSYSGLNNPASVAMNGPITETASFFTPQVAAMAFVQQPGSVLQGATITPEVQVQALDENGQPVIGAGINLSLGNGVGTLSGTLTRLTDSGGLAHFNDLSMNQAGSKTLIATALAGSALSKNSSAFTVIGPVAMLAFTTQPGSAVAGVQFGQQPVLRTVDSAGNPSITGLPASLLVAVTLTNGNGTLLGTTHYNIGAAGSNGVVRFSNLAIDAPGSSNQLVASLASSAFSNSVSGALLWLDSNDASTLTTNGNKVQAWKNKGIGGAGVSGTNLWFTQNSTALQPALGQLNGKPVVSFNKNGSGFGTGCTFLGNIGRNSYTNSSSQMTYFVVARQWENSTAWQGPVSFSGSGQIDGKGTAGVVVLTDGSQGAPYPLGIQRNHATTPMQGNVASAPVNTPFVLTFADNAGAASLFVSESTGLSRSNAANIINGISPYKYAITDVTIGGRLEPSPGTVDNGWDGDVAEVLVYNTALNAADLAAVQNYLTNKWFTPANGITLGNAISAPFAVLSPGNPPRRAIPGIAVNSDAFVTITYSTDPGFPYHLEVTTNVSPASWTPLDTSHTNPSGNTVTFTDPNPQHSGQRYYRSVSP